MSRNLSNKKKKSTSKYRKFKISPLIPIIAIIEVLVLIAVSTYAWFVFSVDKTLNSGVISVDADSGLDIDFQYANITDTINIWNYIPEDFTFEPATSIDGRNIYFPTSGTFGSHETDGITFREGTVNDINTKYINIDFELTNTSDTADMEVYLNNNSYFYVKDKTTGDRVDSKALRLAFYTNDASTGNVHSDLLDQSIASGNTSTTTTSNMVTVYFNNSTQNYSTPYAYVYNSSNASKKVANWPGVKMTHVGGTIYSYSFSTDYNRIIFSDNGSNQTPEVNQPGRTVTASDDGYIYDQTGKTATTFASQTNTLYFIKPRDWDRCYCHLWYDKNTLTGDDDESYHAYPGTEMTEVGANLYAFTYYKGDSRFNSDYNSILFTDGGSHRSNDTRLPAAASRTNLLYYFPSDGSSGTLNYTTYTSGTKILYFYNSLGWSHPYALAQIRDSGSSLADSYVALSSLSSNMYFCTVPASYANIQFYDASQEYVSANKTEVKSGAEMKDGYIFRPTGEKNNSNLYLLEDFSYNTYSSVTSSSYAVISPGVSAGFQRSYNPVVGISSAGIPNRVVPAFANSIDNYIYGSGKQVFTLEHNETKQLSLVIWLEGTDEDCDDSYQDQQIDLRLEFSTYNTESGATVNVGSTGYYTYRFVDATREVWTSDRQSTASGLTVAPVMQLYDATTDRGYLMHGVDTKEYSGKSKVSTWECQAPSTLVSEWVNGAAHHLQFRRVNPYDESEVWNYWDAGNILYGSQANPHTISEAVSYVNNESTGSIEQTIITFTAFADGAPTEHYTNSNKTTRTANTFLCSSRSNTGYRSCGGLWGSFSTTTMTLLDATSSVWFKNNQSVMTIDYTYNYSGGYKAEVEYRASTSYGSMYYFVVPSDVIDSTTKVTALDVINGSTYFAFKRYYDFNSKYAFNSLDYNPNVVYDQRMTLSGKGYGVACFNENYSNSNSANNFWGDRLVFFKISNAATAEHANIMADNPYFRIQYKTSATASSNTKFWLYSNGDHQIDYNSEFNTYVTAIPHGCNYADIFRTSTSNTQWTATGSTVDLTNYNLVYLDYFDNSSNLHAHPATTNDYQ